MQNLINSHCVRALNILIKSFVTDCSRWCRVRCVALCLRGLGETLSPICVFNKLKPNRSAFMTASLFLLLHRPMLPDGAIAQAIWCYIFANAAGTVARIIISHPLRILSAPNTDKWCVLFGTTPSALILFANAALVTSDSAAISRNSIIKFLYAHIYNCDEALRKLKVVIFTRLPNSRT